MVAFGYRRWSHKSGPPQLAQRKDQASRLRRNQQEVLGSMQLNRKKFLIIPANGQWNSLPHEVVEVSFTAYPGWIMISEQKIGLDDP